MELSPDYIRSINESAWQDCINDPSALKDGKDSKNYKKGTILDLLPTVPFLSRDINEKAQLLYPAI
jgi:hypothetical protein